MAGLSWLYGDCERFWCPDCGETYSASARDHQGHAWASCEQKRYANWTLGAARAWKPVRSSFESVIDAAIAKAADEVGVPVALLTAEPGFFQACQTIEDEARS